MKGIRLFRSEDAPNNPFLMVVTWAPSIQCEDGSRFSSQICKFCRFTLGIGPSYIYLDLLQSNVLNERRQGAWHVHRDETNMLKAVFCKMIFPSFFPCKDNMFTLRFCERYNLMLLLGDIHSHFGLLWWKMPLRCVSSLKVSRPPGARCQRPCGVGGMI